MSLSSDRSTLIRLNKEIGELRIKEAAEGKKAAEAQKKMLAAQTSATKSTSPSSRSSYMSTANRESGYLTTAQSNQTRYADQAASKAKDAAKLQEKILKEEERERKATQDADNKRRRDDENRRRDDEARQKRTAAASADANRALQRRIDELEAQLLAQLQAQADAAPRFTPVPPPGEQEAYDVFISHAWEDKAAFVDEFAAKARDAGLKVWYDRFAMEWGDSIRQKIDAGLAGSYFGVAVLSPEFFAKPWPQYELDGLMERAAIGDGRFLPIWHRLTKDEILKHAPSLAGRLALDTSLFSTDNIVTELVKLRDRYKAPLLAADETSPLD